jgi:hypothetical protein
MELEPLLSFLTCDCQLVKEIQAHNRKESKGDFVASYRQTDSKNGLFLDRAIKHREGGVQNASEDGLVNLELQFGYDELVSYTEYRNTELTRKSADWINRASAALWHSTSGTISTKTLTDLRKRTLAKYASEDSKSKVLTLRRRF